MFISTDECMDEWSLTLMNAGMNVISTDEYMVEHSLALMNALTIVH